MSSNSKIGLLLGLVVTFLIAFVMSGLSGIGDVGESNDLSKIMIIDPIGIKPDIKPEVLPPRPVPAQHPEKTPPSENKEQFQEQTPGSTSPDENDNGSERANQTLPKFYIVCQGENLADIAKKFYGPKEGNRIANVKKIYEANSSLLESPDKIYPGQKLIIPALWASDIDHKRIEGIFPESMFEKVESIGRRHF